MLADAIVIVHLLFIGFALLGGLLALWRRWWLWLHLPALGWAALVVLMGWVCPLTPLENRYRAAGYTSSFIEHYLLPIIYPPGLSREQQWLLGLALLAINAAIYTWVIWRWRRSR